MHLRVAACLFQFRGYFLTKYYLIRLQRHLQIPQLSLQIFKSQFINYSDPKGCLYTQSQVKLIWLNHLTLHFQSFYISRVQSSAELGIFVSYRIANCVGEIIKGSVVGHYLTTNELIQDRMNKLCNRCRMILALHMLMLFCIDLVPIPPN